MIAATEPELVDRIARNHGRESLSIYSQPNLRQQAVDADLLDEAAKLIATADRHNRPKRARGRRPAGNRPLRRQQAFDLWLGDPVMSSGGL